MKVKNDPRSWANMRAHTTNELLVILKQHGPQSPYSMAKIAGYAHSTARYYLKRMDLEKLVTKKVLFQKNLFTITDKGRELIGDEVVSNEQK